MTVKHAVSPFHWLFPNGLMLTISIPAGIRQLFSDGGRRFYFYFGEVPQTEGVTGAVLRVYKYSSHWLHDRDPFNIRVFKISNDRHRYPIHIKYYPLVCFS
jgi:hypothetical protein